MNARKTLLTIKFPLALTVLTVALWPGSAQGALAQDATQKIAGDSPAGSDVHSVKAANNGAAPDTNNPNAELLKELEQMRARIEQLENQLKTQSGGATESSSQQAQPAIQTVSLTTTAKPGPAQTGDQAKPEKTAPAEPFAYADWTWLTGNPRTKTPAFDSKFFTPEIRADIAYIYDFNHPADDTIGGSSEVFRSQEFQLTQLGVGGDFHLDNVRGRLLTQFGMYSQTQPRNDASPSRGQWSLDSAYRYLAEAYGGYHFNVLHGINVDAGIFMSYIGLFSFYNFDNWAYQPSYVSSNTPWFFNGMRIQIFPTDKLKIEPWITNGWQSYGRFNHRLGLGGQILWRPKGWISIVGNQYALGRDTLGVVGRTRFHTDDSIQIKYYDHPERGLDKMAFTLTGDAGCESGGGVNCFGNSSTGVKQSFLGFMAYNRFWFHKDLFAATYGFGRINNPGRYLVLLPPIDGATAATGTPYFTENPGDPFKAWDTTATFDYMPSQYITFRWEYNYRHANVPYFSGSGGITPPGGNNGNPGTLIPGFTPDLRKSETRLNLGLMVKF
ncbi:MAG TPA: outer membrane beta-barrel protein [Candidatus Angelobacter sp.]